MASRDETSADTKRGSGHEKIPLFAAFARTVEHQVGRSSTFFIAVGVVFVWAVSGPFFGWSDTWQLVINTGTTIVTFLMVFVIQNTQSRDTTALHLKLDELIRVSTKARNSLLGLEDLSENELERARQAFQRLTAGAAGASEAVAEAREEAAEAIETAPPEIASGRRDGAPPQPAEATRPAR